MARNVQKWDQLDATDQMIVSELMIDGRVSVPVLAERVGVSRATAYARFDRLIDSGVITGFGARVDPSSIGLSVAAVVMMSIEQGDWPDLQAQVLAATGVQWIGLAAGPDDFVVLVRAADLAELRDTVLRELLAIPGIRAAQTSVLLDEARTATGML